MATESAAVAKADSPDAGTAEGAAAPAQASPQSSLPLDRYNLLVEFAHRHLDFHRAELESVLRMRGVVLGRDCHTTPLPNEGSGEVRNRRPFLIISFPMGAVESKFSLDSDEEAGAPADGGPGKSGRPPDVASLLSRCALVKCAVELWGCGGTLSGCSNSVRALSHHPVGRRTVERTSRSAGRSWKITVHTLGSKYCRDEQNAMRARFAFLDFPGPVKMEDPTDEYVLIREVEMDESGSPLYPRRGLGGEILPENDARPPLGVYFGRVLGGARNWREGLDRYSLGRRPYLGPTSMDAELSLVMTNFGLVGKGSFCFDPFAGTGSILLTCGLRGAYCFGTDIDIRVLRGRGADENVVSNFRKFGLPRPELVRCDNALYHRHYRAHRPTFDAIVCDPPYGIRAGARRSGSRLGQARPIPDEHRHDHIAQTRPYAVSDVMADLLDVAARTLVTGGRLVYIIPSMRDFDAAADLPRHECLRLVHICYQPLQLELGRRVVTMEKVAEYDPARREAYLSGAWVNGPESAEKCANIRDRLIEAAKRKPGYEEKAAWRRQKRKATKEAKKLAKREAATASADKKK